MKQRLEKNVRPAMGQLLALRFGSSQIKRYIHERLDDDAAPATVNRELAIIRRAFSLAVRHDPPLLARAPHVPNLKEINIRTGFVEHPEYLAVHRELPDYLKPLLVIGYHVGCRKGEMLMLRREQVDLVSGEIRLRAGETKNGEGRVLPIYGDMEPTLQMLLSDGQECPWLFSRNGKRICRFEKAWRSACERAGVPELLFHDLRRSAVRNMVRAGIPERVAMAISGHKTRAVFERYNIVSDRDLRSAAGKMDAYLAEKNSAETIKDTIKDADNRVTAAGVQ